MALINNDTELRAIIKNVQSTVTGEETLYSKLTLALNNAEAWLSEVITGGITLTSDMQNYAKAVVAHKAFHDAIPCLDLILTPNGFGIVSNQNVAPASAERVKNLRAAELAARDEAIDRLFRLLFASTDYRATERFKWFSSSLFQTPSLALWLGETPINGRFEFFLTTSAEIRSMERKLVASHISQPIFDSCCAMLATGTVTDNLGEQYSHITKMLRIILIASYKNKAFLGSKPCADAIAEIVDYIRSNESLYAIWKVTPAGKAYETADFVNKKNSGGYWL